MQYGICELALIPGKKEPSNTSEMTTQLLFGESYKIIEQFDEWLFIENQFDKYTCWINKKLHNDISEHYFNELLRCKTPKSKQLVDTVHFTDKDTPVHILAGSSLPFYEADNKILKIGENIFQFLGETTNEDINLNLRQRAVEYAYNFLYSPYLWGGRTPFGIDCSGFVQVVFKMLNIALPRDCNEQFKVGKNIDFITNAKKGDLLFFDDKDGNIKHVGIYIADNQIIHSYGKVRIDKVDHYGIFSIENNNYSHKLRLIKNIID